jgi:hypothetical protein
MSDGKTFAQMGASLGALVDRKNAEYGMSTTKAAEIMEVLYPDGIPVAAYPHVLLLVRICDKLSRIAAGCTDASGEDAWQDIAGYGLLGMAGMVKIRLFPDPTAVAAKERG